MISIEGNIGVGKSSVLKILEGRGHTIREEQVHLWTLLPLFYAEKKKYAFAFQLQVLTSYIGARADYMERSSMSALRIFAEMLLEDKFITPIDFTILEKICTRITESKTHIYLRLDAEKCSERIKKRNRKGEETIDLQYLRKLEEKHDKVFTNVINLMGHETPEEIADLIEHKTNGSNHVSS